jgi:hypothetical protein
MLKQSILFFSICLFLKLSSSDVSESRQKDPNRFTQLMNAVTSNDDKEFYSLLDNPKCTEEYINHIALYQHGSEHIALSALSLAMSFERYEFAAILFARNANVNFKIDENSLNKLEEFAKKYQQTHKDSKSKQTKKIAENMLALLKKLKEK